MNAVELPQNWQQVRIGDVCQPVQSRSPAVDGEGSFQYVDISSVDNERKTITDSREVLNGEAPSRARQVIAANDVLVSTVRPNLNAVALVPAELDGQICSTGFCVLRANPALVEPEFLFARVRQPEFVRALEALGRGAGYPAVSDGDVKRQAISLPPLPEQRRIVVILRQAEEIRRKRREAEETIQRLRLDLFEELFGKLQEQSRWESVRVSDAGQVQLGRQRAPKYQTGEFTRPYVRVANVFEDYIDTSDILSMDFDERDFETYRLNYDDILLNEGQSTELVGRPAIWRNEVDDCCFQNTLIRFKADPEKTDPEFALAVFIQYFRNGEFAKISSKTNSIAHLGASRLASMPFPLPPLTLQQSFASRIGTYRTLKESVSASSKQAETLFQSLLSQAFNGELTAAWRETNWEELAETPETVVTPETLETRLAQGTATAADLEETRQRIGTGIEAVLEPLGALLFDTQNDLGRVDAEPFFQLARLVQSARPYYKELIDAGFIRALSETTVALRDAVAAIAAVLPSDLQDFTQEALQDFMAGYTRTPAAVNPFVGLTAEHVVRVFQQIAPDLRQAILELIRQAAEIVLLLARTPDTAHPRYHFLRDLSEAQYDVFLKVQAAAGYVTPASLHETEGISLTAARRGLQMLARNGLIQAVSLPGFGEVSPAAVTYTDAYRKLRPEDDDGRADFEPAVTTTPARDGSSFAERKAEAMGFNDDPNDRGRYLT